MGAAPLTAGPGAVAAAKQFIDDAVARDAHALIGLSHSIHSCPELAFEEHRAAAWLAEILAEAGLAVTVGAYGLDTAVTASAGDGPLRVVLCAEYDALPSLGHACGHNIIAAAAAGAARALAALADDLGITVRLLGTPAEERGGGKVILLERGAFDGAAAALMVHPGPVDLPFMPTLATTGLDARYAGRSAHASAFPERGINAADAVTLAQVALALLRQHLPPDARVHGIVTDGGDAANVVPARAALSYLLRAGSVEELGRLKQRVRACFEAGAVATGATVRVEQTLPLYAELRVHDGLTSAFRHNLEARGRTVRDVTERVRRAAGSTDMGNVSHRLPAIHPMIGLGRDRGVPHQPEFAATAVSPAGDRAVLDGATALAQTVVDAALVPALRQQLVGAPGAQ